MLKQPANVCTPHFGPVSSPGSHMMTVIRQLDLHPFEDESLTKRLKPDLVQAGCP